MRERGADRQPDPALGTPAGQDRSKFDDGVRPDDHGPDLSGLLFPIEGMPGGAQYSAAVIPLTYYLKVVRGIVLKTDQIPMEQWIEELAESLAQEASRSAQAHSALARFLS